MIEGKVRLAALTERHRALYSDPVWLKRDYDSLYRGLKTTFKSKPILIFRGSSKKIVEFIEEFPTRSLVMVFPELAMNLLKNKFCDLYFLPDDLKNADYLVWNSNDVT